MSASSSGEEKVTWVGYLAFVLTIVFFSGFFAKSTEWWRVLDFTVLNGSFGPVNGALTFRGEGGTGAKDGFLFALELAPSVILSLGIIAVTEGLGGLRAAQQLMTLILRPLLGVPGICSLALIANLQNTDAAAGMTKELTNEGAITDHERAIITNYFSSGAALFTFITVPVITPLAVILVFKFVGANFLRLWIAHMEVRCAQEEK
ncbi:TPA: hypothetical protein ACPZ1E_004914 [Enterobacter hormaechei subsp. xiangfangensis]